MAKSISRSLVLLAGIAAISGCQSFGNLQFAKRDQADQPNAEQNRTRFTRQGMDLLRAGNIGQAIEAYNYALATGEEPAPAYNGLGVAYARLGRPDLAYRFFKKATMGAPENLTYARNLARLMDSPEFAVEMNRRRAMQVMPQQPESQALMAQPVVRQPGSLVRSDNGQVSLVTMPAVAVAKSPVLNAAARPCRNRSGKCEVQILPRVESRQPKAEALAIKQQDQRAAFFATFSAYEGDTASKDSQEKRKVIIMPAGTKETTRPERRGQTAS